MKNGAKFEVKPINIHQATTLFLTIVKYYKLMPGKLGRFYPVVKGLKAVKNIQQSVNQNKKIKL